MLNLNCSICAELFNSSDDVHVTTCGHMFHLNCLKTWLQRSKTCPQCRNKCLERNIFKVYFNLANLDTSQIDVGSLQEQLDNANLQVKVKDKELHKYEEQIKSLKETQKKCMKTISALEMKKEEHDFLIKSFKEQVKALKLEVSVVETLRKQIKDLKTQVSSMEGVSTILTASQSETEKLLANENNPRVLAVWVTTLKRELKQSESKKESIRNMLKSLQTEVRKESEKVKLRDERISQLESENYSLQEKIKNVESNDSKEASDSKRLSFIDLRVEELKEEQRRSTISPTIKSRVKEIEESVSPYLNIKSSSLGLAPLFKRNHEPATIDLTSTSTTKIATIKVSPSKTNGAIRKTTSDLTEKYSIFKKPRLGMTAAAASAATASLLRPLGPNYVFNGFGGSEKVDPFTADEAEESENIRKRKTPVAGVPLLAPSLSSRLKAGGLRNIKLDKK